MAELGLSGLASNFDWKTLVEQLTEVERTPQARMRVEQTGLQQRNQAYAAITTQLAVLQNRAKALKEPSLFEGRTVTSSDATIASATATSGAPNGRYEFQVNQLATTARRVGANNVGRGLSETADVSGLALSSAHLAAPITAGTFTVNGKTITLAASDSLQSVFDQISSVTNGDVTASYDPATDGIRFTSAGQNEIILGTATDTSNFLQAARLYNNGTSNVASSSALGTVGLTSGLSEANLLIPINDNGGVGKFKINGIEIAYNATDSFSKVLKRINDSAAGVTATYDSANDRFVLTNKLTGDLGLTVEDVDGNFLAATGLSSGNLERGKNLRYSLNGGGELTSYSNTITESSSGITGLSITALKEATVTVDVGGDSSKIKKAITDFIEEFNRVQTLIETHSAITTDTEGKVTAGLLSGDHDGAVIAARLRSLANSTVGGLSGVLRRFESIGITSNGNDNKLSLSKSEALDAALAGNLNDVKALFTDEASGLASQMNNYLEATIGDEGTLVSHQSRLTKQATAIDAQISDHERIVQSHRSRLTSSFISMELAQAKINQQIQFLSQRFGT